MATDEDDEHGGDDRRGLSDIARAILDHGADYVEARVDLARLETDEAADHIRGLTARFGVGTFATSAGYSICLIAAVALLASRYFDGHWELPALGIGILHLIIGALFLIGAKRQAYLCRNLFASTRRELIKDQQWLKQKSPPAPEENADAPN